MMAVAFDDTQHTVAEMDPAVDLVGHETMIVRVCCWRSGTVERIESDDYFQDDDETCD